MKKCRVCQQGEMTTRSERVHYTDCGLQNVFLLDVPVRRCANCGASELILTGVAALHQLLAQELISQQRKLVGPEIRFLRKYLGWSGADFAEHMGVGPSTVSRWENDGEPIGPSNDRLLRVMVAVGHQIQDYALENLKRIDDKSPPQPVKLRPKGRSGWELDAH